MFKHLLLSISAIAAASGLSTAVAEDPEVYILSGLVDEDTEAAAPADSVPQVDLLQLLIQSADTAAVDSVAGMVVDPLNPDSIPTFEDKLLYYKERLSQPLEIDTSIDVSDRLMPRFYYLPVVYKPYDIEVAKDYTIAMPAATGASAVSLPTSGWIADEGNRNRLMRENLQDFCVRYPWVVNLNLESLPEPPKKYVASVDPKSATIKVEEVKIDLKEANKEVETLKVKRKNWLHTFDGSLQFSQAYNSPNWYQGGNNNLNLIANFIWNVKLNPVYHPNMMFENTVQYKLALNSAPDDTLRNYSISEDRFQINTKFGLKAAHNWYYSVNMQFKTQLLQNHPTNSRSTTVAFFSPGELNLGLGMTYNYTTPNKKATFNISIDPLSYNMIAYTNDRVTTYPGHKTTSQYGSNIEAKMTWKPTYNITYTTRLYTFTNYSYLQGDWENTISFAINRFLTTQIYIHLRYDSSTAKREDTKWHYWQLKEILSFGFAYKFSTL
ncbi:MAG: DUF3078 domain-containing protein [Muribaculaceae bacterium]|nr:DUF3078 domain-containing protein [Muribaculaceae bacterium]